MQARDGSGQSLGSYGQYSRVVRRKRDSRLLLGMGAQHGLEIVLGAQAVADRADRRALRPGAPRHAALDLLARQGLGPDDQAGVMRRQAGGADGVLDALLAEDLHGARIDGPRLGMDRGTGVAFDQQRAHALAAQQDRRREPDRPAAHDQHGNAQHASSRQSG